ncbi:ABC transporter ATP-binding protein [Niabella insulamsoli]|uniref:ABC transporter ATP-binding protein n=1 Tax=Niabella insulamsoli TaxID=3144874 RepID=UPI0031FBE698
MSSFRGKISNIKSNLKISRIFGLIRLAAPTWFYLSIVLIFVETIFFFASLYLMKLLIDVVAQVQVQPVDNTTIIKYVAWSGVAGVLYFVMRSFSAYSIEVLSTKVAEYINEKVHERSVKLELSFYESPSYYDLLKRAMDAGTDKPRLVITTLIELLKNTLSLAAVGSVLLVISWMLMPILAVFIIPTLLIRLKFSKKLNELRIAQTPLERKSSYYSNLITTDVAAKEIRTYSLGHFLKQKFILIRQQLIKDKLSLDLKRTKLEVATTSLSYIGVFFCIGYISLKVVTGETSTGDITLFLVAFPQAFTLLQNLAGGISTVYQNSIYIDSIFELLSLKNTFTTLSNPAPIPAQDDVSIELNNIRFSYPHAEKETIKGISLNIPAGKMIGLVGLNGAGKSTLIKLLCRLYDPTEGTISYGGTDIKAFDANEYRKQLGIVFQDFNRYNFTAGENIHFGNIEEPYDEDRVIEAAKNSGAAAFIEKFPKKYDSMMGRILEEGEEVSIGQWQKLALARCFYSNARFLIFDEASSALDAVSEKDLFNSIRERIGNRGAIIISHRRSAILHADYIYVLSNGKIVEEGTDEMLINANGAYAALFNEKQKSPSAVQ